MADLLVRGVDDEIVRALKGRVAAAPKLNIALS